MTEKQTSDLLVYLTVKFPTIKVNKMTVTAWHEDLFEFEAKEVKAAIRAYIHDGQSKDEQFPPSIKAIVNRVKFIRGTEAQKARIEKTLNLITTPEKNVDRNKEIVEKNRAKLDALYREPKATVIEDEDDGELSAGNDDQRFVTKQERRLINKHAFGESQ